MPSRGEASPALWSNAFAYVRIGFCHKGVVGFSASDISAGAYLYGAAFIVFPVGDLIPGYVEKFPGSAK